MPDGDDRPFLPSSPSQSIMLTLQGGLRRAAGPLPPRACPPFRRYYETVRLPPRHWGFLAVREACPSLTVFGNAVGLPGNRFPDMPWSQTPRERPGLALSSSSLLASPMIMSRLHPFTRLTVCLVLPPLISRDSLPPPLPGSVLVWWLAFDWVGFSPTQLPELGPAHSRCSS